MNAEQHFLSDQVVAVPERWREAFPNGRIHTVQALAAPGAPLLHGLLWVSCDDTHWQQHLAQVRQHQPDLKPILLSNAPDPQEGLLALSAGARGYTHAYAVVELLHEVALVVQHGGLWLGADLLQRMVGSTATAIANRSAQPASKVPQAWALLSGREAQVARLVSAGRSNKEVASALFISERTVKAHLGTVFDKLGVRDRLQLVLRLAASPDSAGAPAQGVA